MSRRLPPLNALRAFEAAARHLSFTKAADELHVTQAAVSHQIKALEEWLGLPLFRRMNRALALTEAGQNYLPPVREAMDTLSQATEKLIRTDSAGALTISTMPSFASKWLVPRLMRFQKRYPDTDVRVQSTIQMVDFTRHDVDLAIRFGTGVWPDLRVERLLTEDIFPVGHPSLLNGERPLTCPEDLCNHTLLHDDYNISWAVWCRAAGIEGVDVDRGLRFDDSSFTLQAAINGHGIALARGVLVSDDIASGRLVRLFNVGLPGSLAYYVVAPPHYFNRPKVKAFRDWLFEEAANTP
ncbi:transcriptional regulator GcvA [Azospirillum agricola]|uniref:transcriptional regulator GcvA n=1 Tax=Azospirillum agricola TaxID=1720247 RepID=UPI000A0F1E1E|nr:transcriptional regulator GcvA [Azospirillum agricola]MBP2227509.1 LysR family glycine cleavage system transcriptional activator [Azospirillum agricola]SMH59571.1 LysR family transcriptional regulator, glycine cleavage system transcriptional activator [Azospirillum lipoferum]